MRLLAAAALLPFAASAATVTIPVAQDATLYDQPTANSGSGPGLFVGSDAQRLAKRALLSFDVAAYIPAGATVTGASLELFLGMVAGGGGGSGGGGDKGTRTLRLYDVTTPWHGGINGTTGYTSPGFGGTGHGFPANPGDPTWVYAAYNTVPWHAAGGDFSATQSAALAVGTSIGSPYVWNSAGTAADVQAWLDGTAPNDGWLVRNDDETAGTTFRAFYSREGATEEGVPQNQPELIVTYAAPAAVPEPSGLAACLLALGALAGVVKRRRV